jgi:steroid 5-alpha reductase family enzyme
MTSCRLEHRDLQSSGGDRVRFARLLNTMRKFRTVPLKIAFPILIVEDILTNKKPHELNPFEEPCGWAVLGLAFVLSGMLLRLWARGHFTVGRLFTTGPYAIVRHPLYLGSFLAVVGVLFVLNDWLNWAVILPLFILFYGATILHEEKALSRRFGEQWRQYKASTPALWPAPTISTFRRIHGSWQTEVYLSTGEVFTTLTLLTLPLILEIIEERCF